MVIDIIIKYYSLFSAYIHNIYCHRHVTCILQCCQCTCSQCLWSQTYELNVAVLSVDTMVLYLPMVRQAVVRHLPLREALRSIHKEVLFLELSAIYLSCMRRYVFIQTLTVVLLTYSYWKLINKLVYQRVKLVQITLLLLLFIIYQYCYYLCCG